MVKGVMATIMLIVAVSRCLAIPKYLVQLNLLEMSDSVVTLLGHVSYGFMCLALLVGAGIILGAIWFARRAEKAALAVS
jgi:hypothetical protein